jgi:serine protease Do
MDDFYQDDREERETDSIYSYSYRDQQKNSTVHEGDYYGGGSYHRYEEPKKKHSGFGKKLATCVILAVVFGLVAGGVFQGVNYFSGKNTKNTVDASESESQKVENTQTNTVATPLSVEVSDVSGIVENVMPSIVAITNMSQTEYYTWFGQSQVYDTESCGSGIIVSDDDEYLYIATNNHVISGANSLTIQFCDDTTVAAEVKGADESTDLAVVSVKKADLSEDTLNGIKIATIGDSDALKVGQPSIAIGNALGYGQSVTTGVISALNRTVTTTDSQTGESTTNELIQTDAAINPGNSGGALLNANGEVIGINSIKYSDTDVEGMGYAIPMATASPIIDKLISREVVDEAQSAYLGIVGVDVTSDVSQSYNMPEGIYIAQIDQGSAADKAGLQKGDILTSFDGQELRSMDDLEDLLQYYAAGSTIDVILQRANNGNYEEMTISVTLGSKK